MISAVPVFVALAGLVSTVSAHACMWHKSMYGFNVTDNTFSYDNRPQVPLYDMTFDQWWMHGHKGYPPNPGDFLELPAGGSINAEISCDKGATSWYNSSQGGDVGFGSNFACPGAQPSAIHTTGLDDVKGCALAIAYQPDVNALKPDDFTIFSVNHTCVWYLNTEFQVPKLPACPEEGCHCAWFWIHSIDSGSEQIYMNAYRCKVTGDVGVQPVGKPALPRRCGADPDNGRPNATPGNCTVGAKLPMYWYQKEGNNMFEGTYEAPYYNDLYGFSDGAQHDVFNDGVLASKASFSVTTPASAPTTPTSPGSSSAAAPTSAPPSNPKPVSSSNPKPASSSNPKPASSSNPKPASSSHAEPASSSAAEVSTVQPSATSSASSTGSTAACRQRSNRKKRDTKEKRASQGKRNHARRLSGHH